MARMGHDTERAALVYLHSSRERQRALADAVGEAARAELARSKKTKKAPPRTRGGHETAGRPLEVLFDLRPDRDSNAGPTAKEVVSRSAASCCFPDGSRFAHRLTALQCLRLPPRSGTRLARGISGPRPSPYHVDSGSRLNCSNAGQGPFRCRPGAGQCPRCLPRSGTRLARAQLFPDTHIAGDPRSGPISC